MPPASYTASCESPARSRLAAPATSYRGEEEQDQEGLNHPASEYEIVATVPVKDGGRFSIALEWSLSRSGRELVRRHREDVYGGGNWLGRFTASPGVYVLNLMGDRNDFTVSNGRISAVSTALKT